MGLRWNGERVKALADQSAKVGVNRVSFDVNQGEIYVLALSSTIPSRTEAATPSAPSGSSSPRSPSET